MSAPLRPRGLHPPRRRSGAVVSVLVLLAVMAAIILWMSAHQRDVDRRVRACIASGGVPVLVTGYKAYTTDYKGCAHPGQAGP